MATGTIQNNIAKQLDIVARCGTDAAIKTALLAQMQQDNSIADFCIAITAAGLLLSGGTWHIRGNRATSEYMTFICSNYGTTTTTSLILFSYRVGTWIKKEFITNNTETITDNDNDNNRILAAATGFSVSDVSISTWGKVAQLYFKATRTGDAITTNTTVSVATLKSGFRPKAMAAAMCSSTDIIFAYVLAAGGVSVNGTWAKNTSKTIVSIFILP